MIRGRISTIITEAERSSENPIHRRVRGQQGTLGLETLTQGGLQVARDGDHHGRRFAPRQLTDQVDLLVGPQRRLEHDDIRRRPRPGSGSGSAETLHGHAQPGGGRPESLAEKEVILDQVEPFAHTFAGYPARPFWSSPNVAIIAPGEWVEG